MIYKPVLRLKLLNDISQSIKIINWRLNMRPRKGGPYGYYVSSNILSGIPSLITLVNSNK